MRNIYLRFAMRFFAITISTRGFLTLTFASLVGTGFKPDLYRTIKKKGCQGWCTHGLRARKCIKLILKGDTNETVMGKLTWSSLSSLERYSRISAQTIRDLCKKYEDVFKFL